MRTIRVLFVCTGNLCRSPMAEAILRHLAEEKGLSVEVASAGTHASYGSPMTPLAHDALLSLGINPHNHYSKPLDEDLLNWANLVLVMTQRHLEDIERRFGGSVNLANKLFLLDEGDIDDPYGGTPEEYVETAKRIRRAIERWLRKLKLI